MYKRQMMNGSEAVTLPDAGERRKLRASYGFGEDDFVLGIMARIEVYKGHDDILEALRFLLDEGRRVKLIIAGSGSYESELRRKAAAFPEGTVVFAGFISDISRILSVMDVQINASYESETSSLSVIEGMSAGVPSVVSDCGGNPVSYTHLDAYKRQVGHRGRKRDRFERSDDFFRRVGQRIAV